MCTAGQCAVLGGYWRLSTSTASAAQTGALAAIGPSPGIHEAVVGPLPQGDLNQDCYEERPHTLWVQRRGNNTGKHYAQHVQAQTRAL